VRCLLLEGLVWEQLALAHLFLCYRGTYSTVVSMVEHAVPFSHEACAGATLTDSVSAPRPRQAPPIVHLEINRDIHRGKEGTRACYRID
jgi:hypothetical protein